MAELSDIWLKASKSRWVDALGKLWPVPQIKRAANFPVAEADAI